MKKYDTINLKSLQEKTLMYLNDSNLTSYQLWKETGISEASIGKYRNGTSNPNFANSKVLLDYFESQNGKTGKGDMLKTDAAESPTAEGLPLIPFECIAGFGDDNAGIILNECEIYNIPEFRNIGAEFLVRVGGSSMYPKYSSGDILACRKIHDILFFQWGKVYVIDSSQGQLIKRICEHENPEMIMLVSDNREKYPPFAMPKSDIRCLSIVLGAVRME